MNPALQQVVAEIERAVDGKLAFWFHDLKTGQGVGHRQDEPVATASTYKLPLLIHCALLVEEGRLSWNQPFELQERLKSRGTGVLKDLTAGTRLTLQDVCYLMIALSDNTAADMLVNHLGIEAVNQSMRDLGFSVTRLEEQNLTAEAGTRAPLAAGITTPREMGGLLCDLAEQRLASPESTRKMLHMLSAQQDLSMIPRHLPPGWQYAGKTGSNPDLRVDVGLVTGPAGARAVLALFCQHPETPDWSVDSPGILALARLARFLLIENRGGAARPG